MRVQVGQLEEEVAVQKRAMEADLRERAAEAERLKAAVEELRSAAGHDVADSEAAILGLQVLPAPAHSLPRRHTPPSFYVPANGPRQRVESPNLVHASSRPLIQKHQAWNIPCCRYRRCGRCCRQCWGSQSCSRLQPFELEIDQNPPWVAETSD